jgi:colicin import membrane protein
MVLQAIGQHWLIPNDADKTLATKLLIYLAPGGVVLDAEIYQSSGNPALDISARAAVFKASPLPVPTDSAAFNFFRRFVLVFRPMYFQQNGQFELQSKTNS